MSEKSDLIGTGALARMLAVSRQRISQLVAAGVLVRKGRGEFDLAVSVRSYITYLRTQPMGADGTGAALDYATERARLTRLMADKLAHELAVMRGGTISIADAVRPFGEACTVIRQRFLGLPTKCAPMMVGQDAKGAFGILNREVNEILTELSTDAAIRARTELAEDEAKW